MALPFIQDSDMPWSNYVFGDGKLTQRKSTTLNTSVCAVAIQAVHPCGQDLSLF